MPPTDLSLNRVTARRLIEGCYQGAAGNCASIAAIKAGLIACFPEPIVLRPQWDGQVLSAYLRDMPGNEFRISRNEMEVAGRNSRFEGEDVELVELCKAYFAVMVKRRLFELWAEDDDTRTDPLSALEEVDDDMLASIIDDLNNGEYYKDTPSLLGLGRWVVVGPSGLRPRRKRRFLRRHEAAIAANRKHAWFVSNGLHDVGGRPDGRERATSVVALVRPT